MFIKILSKGYLFLLIFSIFNICLFSQDDTWFTDITNDVGLEGVNGTNIQCVDINGDLYPDLLWGTGGLTAGNSNTFKLYLNVENPDHDPDMPRIFVDYTEESGINVNRNPEKSYREYDVAVLADVDNDGDRDLVTSFYYHRLEWFNPGHSDRSEVYLNDGSGHFTLLKNAGLNDHQFVPQLDPGMIDAVGISYIDYDYDGILDLYIATKFIDYKNGIYFPDILMKGNGDGSFTEITDNGVKNVPEPLYGINVTDWNNDGWQDVITSPYCRTTGRLLENMKDGTFRDVESIVGYTSQYYGGDWVTDQNGNTFQQPLCQWEAIPADYDNDGDMDLLQVLVHGGYQERNGLKEGRTVIAVNEGPPDYKYHWDLDLIKRDAPEYAHLGDYGGMWIDLENDGLLDLCICEGHYTEASRRLYVCRQSNGIFDDITAELGLTYIKDASSCEAVDFDLDGDNDIFVAHNTENGTQLRLLRNNKAKENNWISVKLVAPQNTNRDAIGSRIYVHSGKTTQIRELQVGLGHFGGEQPFIRNIGLGKRNRVDSIVVRWPNKDIQTTTVYNPPLNTIIEIDGNASTKIINPTKEQRSVVHFDRALFSFDTVLVDQNLELVAKITNISDKKITLNSVDLVDTNGVFEFKPSINFPFVLEAHSQAEFNVSFSPLMRQDYYAYIEIRSDADNAPVRSLDLWGYGYSPKPFIKFSDDEFVFDDGYAGVLSEKTLTVTNLGELPLEISEINFTGNQEEVFSVSGADLPLTLDAQESVELKVGFLPTGKNDYSGHFSIISNAFNTPVAEFNVYGISDGPISVAELNTILLLFGKVPVGQTIDKSFIITNSGDAALKIDSVYFEEFCDMYSFPDQEFPFEVAAGEQKEVVVRFEPKAQERYNTMFTMVTNAWGDTLKTVNVRGNGGEPASVSDREAYNEYFSVVVKPNPVSDNSLIEINSAAKEIINAEINIIDPAGRNLLNIYSGLIKPGMNEINLRTDNISGLNYMVVSSPAGMVVLPVLFLD